MGLENLALAKTDDLPIRHFGEVHSGKVRSVYWLTPEDSRRLLTELEYQDMTHEDTQLGVMVISDRISAFDANWKGEDGLAGIPGKGAALNAISSYWFKLIQDSTIITNHIIEEPHPLVWIVEKAQPVMVEFVLRQYITGSMWRAYESGRREFCGVTLPEGLEKNQKLDELLLTPTTKGVIKGVPGIPEEDDAELTVEQITRNYKALGLEDEATVSKHLVHLLGEKFNLISEELGKKGQLYVDTKNEVGYIRNRDRLCVLILIDEAGTPDSSRYWDAAEYAKGRIVENSKEGFRQFLIGIHGDVLTKGTIGQRKAVASSYKVPVEQMMKVAETYKSMAELITGAPMPKIENPRQEILEALSGYGIVL